MTLKLKLIGMTAGMVLFLAMVNYVQFGRVLNKQKSIAVSQVESQAATLVNSVASQFFERYKSVQTMALNDSMRREKMNEEELTNLFNAYVRSQGIYDVVMLVDAKGNFVASNQRSIDGRPLAVSGLRNKNYSNSAWFRNSMAGQFSEEPKKGLTGTYVEDVSIDALSTMAYGESRFGNSFSTAVKNHRGETTGVLTIRTNFAWVENEFKNFYTFLKDRGYASAELSMVNKNGFAIVDYNPSGNKGNTELRRDLDNTLLKQNLAGNGTDYLPATELTAGRSGAVIAVHPLTKAEQATGYSSMRGTPRFLDSLGWGVIVAVNENEAYAAVTAARNQFIWVSTLVMCAFAIFSYWFAVSVGQNLAKLSHYISDTSAQVMAGSEQMSSASQSLASTATEAASSLEETVSSIEQLTAMVKRNADHAMEAANLSRASRESADEGEVEIKKLVEAMHEINQSSKKIEDIINVIDDIAFQTNLLALNAAVEAARAGDQGKGFAVVAEEVRNLAQRSAAAAKDITSLIKENVTKIESGVQIAGHGGQALRAIVSSVRKVADLNSEIASASKEQSHGLEQISQAMTQLDQVTQTNAASAEEVASSAEEMSSQGLMMQETVSRLNTLIHGAKAAKLLHEKTAAVSQATILSTRNGGAPNVIPLRSKVAAAEKVIPFDDDKGNLGSTSGF